MNREPIKCTIEPDKRIIEIFGVPICLKLVSGPVKEGVLENVYPEPLVSFHKMVPNDDRDIEEEGETYGKYFITNEPFSTVTLDKQREIMKTAITKTPWTLERELEITEKLAKVNIYSYLHFDGGTQSIYMVRVMKRNGFVQTQSCGPYKDYDQVKFYDVDTFVALKDEYFEAQDTNDKIFDEIDELLNLKK